MLNAVSLTKFVIFGEECTFHILIRLWYGVAGAEFRRCICDNSACSVRWRWFRVWVSGEVGRGINHCGYMSQLASKFHEMSGLVVAWERSTSSVLIQLNPPPPPPPSPLHSALVPTLCQKTPWLKKWFYTRIPWNNAGGTLLVYSTGRLAGWNSTCGINVGYHGSERYTMNCFIPGVHGIKVAVYFLYIPQGWLGVE